MKAARLHLCAAASVVLVTIMAGCQKPTPPREAVIEISTTDFLASHPHMAQAAVSNVVAGGDTGVGVDADTGRALVWLDGQCFRVSPDSADQGAQRVAWAAAAHIESNLVFDVGEMNTTIFQKAMDWKKKSSNDVTLVRVDGLFRSMTLLASPLQVEGDTNAPPPVTMSNLSGTLVGFRAPGFLSGVAPGGYYLHFIDQARHLGGRVREFDLVQGRIVMDPKRRLELVLPNETDAASP